MGRLNGKVAIISGASRGIGFGTAKVFAEEGAKVVMFSRSDKMDAAEAYMKEQGYDFLALRADATKDEDWSMVVNETLKKYGKLDVVFNNAGGSISPENQAASNWDDAMTDAGWYEQFEQNYWTDYRAVKACLPELIKTKGNIILMGSVTVTCPQGLSSGYAPAKAAATKFAKDIAKMFGPKGVRVNVVHPGFIWSDLTEFCKMEELPIVQEIKGRVKLDREDFMGKPEDIGRAVAFLASDDAEFITGIELLVDGGYHL